MMMIETRNGERFERFEDSIHPDSHIEGETLQWCVDCYSLTEIYVDEDEGCLACAECGWLNMPDDEWEGV